MAAPYVLTDDLPLVFAKLTGDSEEAKRAVRQSSQMIRTSLQKIFPVVETIPADKISRFLNDRVAGSDLPAISLTGLITGDGKRIAAVEASRTVSLEPVEGIYFKFRDSGILPRLPGLPDVKEQFRRAVEFVADSKKPRVNIVDDVVFSGGTILNCANQLAARGIEVDTVIANVAINGSVAALGQRGIKMDADYYYDAVIDEVCMRDFIVGAPGGGRNLLLGNGQYVSVPYLYPYGNVGQWASIGRESAAGFSKDCLEASLNIWAALAPDMKFSDLSKPVFKSSPDERIVDSIERMLERKEYDRFANTL
ncbi:MAG: hypothetical protein WC989_02965 [Micavibrio sp.]